MLLVVLPIGILIGAVLGLVGSGGALMSTPLLMLTGEFDFQAASTSALFVVLTSSALALAIRHKGDISWRLVITAIIWGTVGSPLGVLASHYISDEVSRIVLAALLILAGYLTWNSEKRLVEDKGGVGGPVLAASLFVFVGFMTGLTGIGGGYILVPVLYLVLGLTSKQAITTSLYVVVFNALVSLGLRAMNGINLTVEQWQASGIIVVAALAGTVAGAMLSNRLDKGIVQKIFSILLFALCLGLIIQVLV